MVPNIHVESSLGLLLTVDKVEKIQRQKIASIIGHVFQLTYAAVFDTLIAKKSLIAATAAPFITQVKENARVC